MRNQRLRPDPPGSAPSSRTPNAAITKAKALAATAAALLLWASAFAAIRLALRSYGPAELALLRFAVASMVFGGCAMTVRPRLRLPERRAWTAMLGLGLLGLVIYHLALNAGERTTTAGSASLLVATAPLFTAVFAVWLDGQRLHGRQVLGLGVGFAGAALLAASGPGGLRLDVGAMLVLVAAASEAAYFVLQQRYLAVYRPLVVAASTTWAATALLLPAAPAAAVQLGRAAPQATAAMVFLGVFPTAGAYLAWSYALARQSAVHTTSSLYVLPVLAIVIAWAWLGEVPQPLALIGGGLALLGVGIAQALR